MAKKSFITMTSENLPHPFPPSPPWALLYSYDEGGGDDCPNTQYRCQKAPMHTFFWMDRHLSQLNPIQTWALRG